MAKHTVRRKDQRSRARAPVDLAPQLQHSRLRLIGVGLVCAKVALVPLVIDSGADIPFTVPKGLLSHALAYLLAAVILGLIAQFNWRVVRPSPLHIPVLIFLGANLIATPLSIDVPLALYGTHDRMVGLATLVDEVVLYFAIVSLIRRRVEAAVVVAAGLTASALILTYELVQFLGLDPLSWSVDPQPRPFSTFGQTTQLAEYLVVVTVGAAAYALFDTRLGVRARALLFGYSGLALAGVVITQTRSAVLGIVAAAILLVILVWVAHPNRRTRFMTLIAAGGGGVALSLILFLTPLGSRVLSTVEISTSAEGDTGASLEQSADVRVALFTASLDMVRDRPLFGYGPDNFLAAFPQYRSEHEPFEVQQSPNTSAHGWLAQVGSTAGAIGLAAFVAVPVMAVWLTLKSGFRPDAWAPLAMLFAWLGAGITTVNGVATDWIFWTAAGGVAVATLGAAPVPTAAVPSRTTARRSSPDRETRSTARTAVGWSLLAVGLMLALTAASAYDASRSARASQVARLQGRAQQAIDLGVRAARADPGRPQYWDTLGLAYVSADRFKDAAPAFEQAVKRAPYDIRYHGDLARAYVVLIQRGDATLVPRAREVADAAVQVDPNNPLANQTRAVVMQITNDLPEALKSNERALALDQSNNREIYLTGTQVLLGLGRPADAAAMARLGITRIPNPLNQVQIRTELVRALIADGKLADALTEVNALLGIQPNQATALQLKAQIQAAMAK